MNATKRMQQTNQTKEELKESSETTRNRHGSRTRIMERVQTDTQRTHRVGRQHKSEFHVGCDKISVKSSVPDLVRT